MPQTSAATADVLGTRAMIEPRIDDVSAPTRTVGAISASRPVTDARFRIDDTPVVALAAYQRGAMTLKVVDRRCHLSWSLLAAIGEVETDHGRRNGAVLGADGVSRPLLRSRALDGSRGAPRVTDSDDGTLDGDRRWDRAVGPMQIVPSTWQYLAVDGDGDGVRSPDDLDDAALATAVFFCGTAGDLRSREQVRSAVHRFNSAPGYTRTVLRIEARYRHHSQQWLRSSGPDSVLSSGTAEEVTSTIAVVAAGPATDPGRGRRSDGDGGRPAVDGPAADEEPRGPAPEPAGPPTSSPEGEKPPSPAPEPAPEGPPEPDPESEVEPDPVPDSAPPPPPPGPVLMTLRGTLELCDSSSGWCAAGTALDLSSTDLGGEPAAADFDGDGSIASRLEELTGLAGHEVVLLVVDGTTPALVHSVNGAVW